MAFVRPMVLLESGGLLDCIVIAPNAKHGDECLVCIDYYQTGGKRQVDKRRGSFIRGKIAPTRDSKTPCFRGQ